jgi:alpha-tubulin suppressor-like RCC1 family protein
VTRIPGICALLLIGMGCDQKPRLPTEAEPTADALWSRVAAGTYFSCGIIADEVPHCWGFYSAAEGTGGSHAVTGIPVPVPGAVFMHSIAAGGGIACGLAQNGDAYCWGQESMGELGNGGSEQDSTRVPVPVQGDLQFASISVGYTHTCGLTLSGQGYCWGENLGGALGTGEFGPGTQHASPARVVGNLTFASISAGTTQTCAITTEQRAYCWGGGYGSVGVSDLDPARCLLNAPCVTATPQLVSADIRFSSISAGNGFTCAVAANGAGYCWGGMFAPSQQLGVLGSGSTGGSPVPVVVAGTLGFTSIRAGTRAACGISIVGAAYCWGGNGQGELGIGTVDGRPHPFPEAVHGGLRFSALSVGEVSCGLALDSALYCWGTTYAGLLGNGETQPGVRPVPTRVQDPLSP